MNMLLSGALLGLLGLVACGGGGGGASAPQVSTSAVPAAPGISSFTSTLSTITAGSSVSLAGVFSNGIGTITPGNLPATSGAAITVSPTATTTYTLTVTNSAGASVTQTVTIDVAAASVISAFSADHETVLAPGAVNLIATFTGGTGVIMPGNLGVTSGTPVPVAGLTATTTFTLAVTNSAGTAATMPLTVRVGTVSVLAGNPGVAGNADGQGASAYFSNPQGLTVDGAGSIYVADYGNACLRKISPAGFVSTLASGMPYLNSVAVKTDGTVYVTTASTQASVTELSPAGIVQASGIGSPNGGTYLPWGVAVDGAGDLFIANDVNNAITKITPAGVQSYLSDGMNGSAAVATLMSPTCVATDAVGNVYIGIATTLNSGYIYMITPAGSGSFIANGTFAGNPTSLAADGAGNLYVVAEAFAQQGAYPFAMVSSAGTVTPWAVPQPTAVAVDPATGNLYLTSNQTVLKIQF